MAINELQFRTAEFKDLSEIIACAQLTYVSYLSPKGVRRAIIEGVRVSSKKRNLGIGNQIFSFLLDRARNKACKQAQLTSDKRRTDAIRFYQRLGFTPSHEGLKINL